MNIKEINSQLIGKRCTCACFGEVTTGTIEEARSNKHCGVVRVKLDKAVRWGNDWFDDIWAQAETSNEDYDTLQNLHLLIDPSRPYRLFVGFREIDTAPASGMRVINRKQTNHFKIKLL